MTGPHAGRSKMVNAKEDTFNNSESKPVIPGSLMPPPHMPFTTCITLTKCPDTDCPYCVMLAYSSARCGELDTCFYTLPMISTLCTTKIRTTDCTRPPKHWPNFICTKLMHGDIAFVRTQAILSFRTIVRHFHGVLSKSTWYK